MSDISINLLSKFDLKRLTLSGIGFTLISSSGSAPPFAFFTKSYDRGWSSCKLIPSF